MYPGASRAVSFADCIWSEVSLRKDVLLIAAGSLFVAVCSRIEIPLQPVPITAQTLAVLLLGALLGAKRGSISVIGYLGLGAGGLPVFAGGASGPASLFGPTAGYLIGFLAATATVGLLSERGWDRRVGTTALAMVIGNVLIYVLGVAWLAQFVGWQPVLRLGVLPFLVGDAVKIGIAAFALPLGWSLIGRGGFVPCRQR
jgi:biotin transport system substrate-specific component